MTKTFTFSIAAVALMTLYACADKQWVREGADTAAVSRDLDQCRGAALRNTAPAGAPGSQDALTVDRAAAPFAGRPAGSANERFIAEHEDTRRCMSAKGYQLR